MACKKSELVEAINSYAAARSTGDAKLQQFSASYVEQLIETLEFGAEEKEEVADPSESAND